MNTQHKLLSSCPVSCFADEIAESLDRQIEVLSRLGISYVELRSADGINVSDFTMNFAKEVKKKLDQANIRISAIGSPIGKIGIDDDFDAHLQKLSHTEQMADIFETPYIRMFSFYIPENYAAADCRSEVLFRTEAMVAEAAHNNITLLHENEKGIYGDNASRCLDLMQQFAGKHFSCTFDFANFIQCGQDPSEAYEMLSPYISYVHVKDALFATGEVVPAGTGDGHLPKIFQKLDASGYHGFLSLEPHLANFSGLAAILSCYSEQLPLNLPHLPVKFGQSVAAMPQQSLPMPHSSASGWRLQLPEQQPLPVLPMSVRSSCSYTLSIFGEEQRSHLFVIE